MNNIQEFKDKYKWDGIANFRELLNDVISLMSFWKDYTKEKPTYSGYHLILRSDWSVSKVWYCRCEGGGYFLYKGKELKDVTNWMELPNFPEEKNNE